MTDPNHLSRGSDTASSELTAWLNTGHRHAESMQLLVALYLHGGTAGLNVDEAASLLGRHVPVNSNTQHRYGELAREYFLANPRYVCRVCHLTTEGEVDPRPVPAGASKPFRPALPHLPVGRAVEDNPCPQCGFNITKYEMCLSTYPDCRERYRLFINPDGHYWAERIYRGGVLPRNFREERKAGQGRPVMTEESLSDRLRRRNQIRPGPPLR